MKRWYNASRFGGQFKIVVWSCPLKNRRPPSIAVRDSIASLEPGGGKKSEPVPGRYFSWKLSDMNFLSPCRFPMSENRRPTKNALPQPNGVVKEN
jgi:hypothetical protein